jgi:hypothetical protein
VDKTSIEELIIFARTKPRKGRPRKDAAAKTEKAVVKTRQEEETSQQALETGAVANQESHEARQPLEFAAAASNTRTADGEDLFEIIKSWEQHKSQTTDASYAAVDREQG